MQEPALPVALYDFLYKDAERMASYYAQLFQGRLLSTERTTTDKSVTERSGKFNAGVVAGDAKASDEVQNAVREVMDPHDRAVNDVLAYFRENGYLYEDVEAAPPGSVILAKGTLNLADGTVLRMVVSNIGAIPPSMLGATDENSAALLQFIGPMLASLEFPSAFLLQTDTTTISGTLKPSGLQEPIPSYYYKQGNKGLADVYLIGIKEHIVDASLENRSDLFGVTQLFAQALSNMVLPQDGFRVIPLAMFRVLS